MNGYVLVTDRDPHVYILHSDGMWCTPQFSRACGLHPKIFARRIHARQFLQTRALGWFLTTPGGRIRLLTAKTAGVDHHG